MGSKIGGEPIKLLQQAGRQVAEQGKGVYRVDTTWGAVMYYPHSGHWLHRGRKFPGAQAELLEWLSRNGL